MSWSRHHDIPWDYITGEWLAGTFMAVSVFTPQYTLTLSPHFPLTATLLSVVFAVLMLLVRRRWSPQPIPRVNGPLSVLYTLFCWVPFILSWVLFSQRGGPPWLAAIVGLTVPSLLMVYAYQQRSTRLPSTDLLYRVLMVRQGVCYGLILVTSLFYGYGVLLFSLFMYSQGIQQGFGPVVLEYLSPLFLGGAVLSGAIFAGILRGMDRLDQFGTYWRARAFR